LRHWNIRIMVYPWTFIAAAIHSSSERAEHTVDSSFSCLPPIAWRVYLVKSWSMMEAL
jgi:hypothetical protein